MEEKNEKKEEKNKGMKQEQDKKKNT